VTSAVQQNDHVIVDGRDLTEEQGLLQSKLNHPGSSGTGRAERRQELATKIQRLEMEIRWAQRDRPMSNTPSGVLFFTQSSN
jgi:hypothetical protein